MSSQLTNFLKFVHFPCLCGFFFNILWRLFLTFINLSVKLSFLPFFFLIYNSSLWFSDSFFSQHPVLVLWTQYLFLTLQRYFWFFCSLYCLSALNSFLVLLFYNIFTMEASTQCPMIPCCLLRFMNEALKADWRLQMCGWDLCTEGLDCGLNRKQDDPFTGRSLKDQFLHRRLLQLSVGWWEYSISLLSLKGIILLSAPYPNPDRLCFCCTWIWEHSAQFLPKNKILVSLGDSMTIHAILAQACLLGFVPIRCLMFPSAEPLRGLLDNVAHLCCCPTCASRYVLLLLCSTLLYFHSAKSVTPWVKSITLHLLPILKKSDKISLHIFIISISVGNML